MTKSSADSWVICVFFFHFIFCREWAMIGSHRSSFSHSENLSEKLNSERNHFELERCQKDGQLIAEWRRSNWEYECGRCFITNRSIDELMFHWNDQRILIRMECMAFCGRSEDLFSPSRGASGQVVRWKCIFINCLRVVSARKKIPLLKIVSEWKFLSVFLEELRSYDRQRHTLCAKVYIEIHVKDR